ncbi:MAG: pitrilysin family protein [Chloroflexia bacterium]
MYGDKTVLPNGVRVLSFSMPHVRSVSMILTFDIGSRYETDEHAGISHFIEHMLFKGTTSRPSPELVAEEIEGVGGILNAYTSREQTGYWAKVPSTHFVRSFGVLADMVRNSLFDQEELDRERGVIIEEIRAGDDDPSSLVWKLSDEIVWDGQAVGRPIAGSEESVGRIDRAAMLDYLHRHYSPANLVISVAGNVTHAEVVRQAEEWFGSLPAGDPTQLAPASLLQTAPRAGLLSRTDKQANLVLALPGLSYHDERRYVQRTLDVILGEGMTSRLFIEIRERRGLAYSVGSYFNQLADTGNGAIYAGVDPGKTRETVAAIVGELRKLRETPVPADELARSKELRKGRMLMSLEDSYAMASWLGSSELLYGFVPTPEEVAAKVDAVTVADVQALASELFTPERYSLALVGPFEDEAEWLAFVQGLAA